MILLNGGIFLNKLYSVHINESGFFLCMFGLRRHLGFDDWYGLEILQNQKLKILQKIPRDFRQISCN